jgi:hypothetical protein
VQDRAGAADGTSSASGVTQVTPIEQLNSKSARIGTSASAVADGALAIGDKQADAHADANELIIATSAGNAGLTINTANNVGGSIYFADGTGGDDLYRGYMVYNHSSNSMVLGTDALTRLTIASTGAVSLSGAASGAAALTIGNTTGDTDLEIIPTENTSITLNAGEGGTSRALIFSTGGTPRVEIQAAGLATFKHGLAFTQTGTSATGAATTSTTLDHYEVGTWTPVVKKGASAALSLTTAIGKYTRVGNIVWLSFYCHLASGTESTSGSWNVTGIPFSLPGTSGAAYQSIAASYMNLNGSSMAAPARWQNNSSLELTMYGTNGSDNWASGALEFSGSGVFMVS